MARAVRAALAMSAFAISFQIADATAAASSAQAYPAKPVRMVVPLAPGGGSDIVGRIVAQALAEQWGRSVIVDNRAGAGSAVGTSIAAKAAPDGYTVLASSSSIAMTPALYRDLDFDVKRDFAAVTLIASQPSILAVHPSVAAGSVKDLIAIATPGKLSYASAGVGSATHLGTELLLHSARTQMLHVPYKSAGQATTAVVAGETHVLLTNMASVLPHIASGKLKAVGISSLKRSPAAPDVPTISETGLPGFEYSTWYGMLAPARTRPGVIDFIQRSIASLVKAPQVAERFTRQGLHTYASSPADFDRYLKAEVDRWARVVKAAKIRVE